MTDVYVGPSDGGNNGKTVFNHLCAWTGSAMMQVKTTGGDIGCNGIIHAMAVSGNTLYVGGEFTTCLGTAAAHVASIDVTTPTAPTSAALSTGLDDTCYALVYSTDLYAAGAFTSKVRRYNSGAWAAWGTGGPAGTCYALAKSGNDVYAGGNWTSPSNYIAKTTSGGAWGALSTGLPGVCYSIAIDGSNIIAGYDGTQYVKYFNGSAWTSMGTGVNGIVYALLVDTTWLVCGNYTTADGFTMYRISRYSASTAPTTMSLQSALDIIDDHQHQQPLFFGGGVSVGAGNTEYGGFGASSGATAGDWKYPFPAGTFYEMRCRTASAQPANNKMTGTLRVNGASTALTVDITNALGIGTVSDLVHTVTIVDGDLVNFMWDNLANATSATMAGCTIMFKPA